MGTTVRISFNTDEEGFLSQECPGCERRFKAKLGEGSDEPISFCPYCDYTGRDCWWTQKQAEYLSAKAAEEVLGPELEKLTKAFGSGGGGLFSVKATVTKSPTPPVPPEPDEDWPVCSFDCCGETIRHDGQNDSLYCVICGTEASLEEPER